MTKIQRYLVTIFVFVLFASFPLSSFAEQTSNQEPDKYVKVNIIADKTKVKGGDTVRIGIVKTIYPKWHTYWKNPGDSGTPAKVKWELPPEFSVSDLEWPTPLKIPYGPLTNYGYEKEVVLLQNLTLPEKIGNVPFILTANIDLLVCHEICIPENHQATILFNANTAPQPDKIKAAESLLPRGKNWNATYRQDGDTLAIHVITEDTSGISKAQNPFIAPENWGAIDNNADANIEILNTGFLITQKIGERDLSEIENLPIVISYENEKGIQAIRLVAKPSSGIASTAPKTKTDNNKKPSLGIFQALVFALLGGMILNLMPCVFPVLSMKALSLINLKDKEEKTAKQYGLSYTAGILASFGVIAALLLLLKAGGAQIGWGFQLQNPAVIIFLTYLVFIIGLNLAGFFEFSNKLAGVGQNLTQKSSHSGAFFTGVLATIVATPCTAPFMGAAMGFALTQSAFISMLVFLTLGLGLALPYLALCYFPSLRAKLPKPGHWMETFKQFLSFPMFITSAWLVWILSQQVGSLTVFCTLLGLVALTFIIWLFKVMPQKGFLKIVTWFTILIAISFILSPIVMPSEQAPSTDISSNAKNWEDFNPNRLESLLKGDNAVFTNMTAAWCITCKVNEKVALSTDKAKTLFAKQKVSYLKGDWTNQNPEITQYLNSFGHSGVPLYVYYGPRDNQSGKRPDPVVLPQLLTFGLVEKIILQN